MLRYVLPSIAALSLLMSGCVKQVDLKIQTSECLNPAEYCNEDGSNSKVLDVYVYQLIDPIPKYQEQHELLRDPSVVFSDDTFAPFLAEPHIQAMDPTSITLTRNRSTVFTIEKMKKAKYVMLVTDGRQVEDNSIQIIPISRLQDRVHLCFEYYGGLYIEPLAENYCHFEFQLPSTTGVIGKEKDE